MEQTPFSTDATTSEEFYRDLAAHTARSAASRGLVAPALGVTRSTEVPMRTSQEFLDTVAGWQREQTTRTGGIIPNMTGDKNYRNRRFDFLSREEGIRLESYDDATGTPFRGGQKQGRVTIGVGFNMDRPDARDVLAKALGPLDFDKLYSGQAKLTRDQAQRLFDHTAQEAEDIVNNKFRGVPMTEHQRLALVSLAFNNPALIGPNLTRHVREQKWDLAADEILNRSNAARNRGIASRRYREAAMFVGDLDAKRKLPRFQDYMSQFA